MVGVIINWAYISLICTLIGFGCLSCLKGIRFRWIHYLMAGMIAVTVYVEFFSIFWRIKAAASLALLAAALCVGFFKRSTPGFRQLWTDAVRVLFSWEGFFYCCFVLLIAFYTSRGEFHTDTNIYHAAMIRLYEEYGLIKGMGNLQLHYAYNSAYLAFAAVFDFGWLLGRPLHTTTGWLEVVMCIYAFRGLKDFKRHKTHKSDMMKAGILFYTLVNLTRSMSPATDYAAMFLTLFILTAWCECLEKEDGADPTACALLSAGAVYVATVKFSACLLVLLALYPASALIKEKRWRETIGYLLCGIVILMPFLIRNYYISGWLLYPFDKIDIFHPEWKVPKEYLLVDAAQIKTWGRCLYDVAKVDVPVSGWLPVWWEHQFRYEQMFLVAAVLAAVLQALLFLSRIVGKRRIRCGEIVLHLSIWADLLVWFFMAPFIRYGLAFLFAVIMIAVGGLLEEELNGFAKIMAGSLLFCIVVSVSPYWDQYITDAGVFFKHNLTKPYYLVQQDYDRGSMAGIEIKGNTIYYACEGEVNSYYACPSTCYYFMLERSTLIGDRIEDGFRAKSGNSFKE